MLPLRLIPVTTTAPNAIFLIIDIIANYSSSFCNANPGWLQRHQSCREGKAALYQSPSLPRHQTPEFRMISVYGRVHANSHLAANQSDKQPQDYLQPYLVHCKWYLNEFSQQFLHRNWGHRDYYQ